MKKITLILMLLTGYLYTYSQDASIKLLKDKILDIKCERFKDSLFNDFIDSMPDLHSRKGQLIPFSIYEFGTPYLTFINIDKGIIDTSLFSKDYFLSGRFIKDFYDKTQSGDLTDAYISCGRTFIYDTIEQRTYRFADSGWSDRLYYDEWDKKNGKETDRKPFKYLSLSISYPFEDYIGYLLYHNMADVVFFFPTYLDYDEKLIITLSDICFAIKGENILVISKNWTPENRDNNPVLYSLEDYLNLHWEEMTNLPRK